MRSASLADVIELVAPTQEGTAKATARLQRLFTPVCNLDTLTYGVKEGWLQLKEVALNGEIIGCIWYHASPNKELIVNALATLAGYDQFPVLVAAAKLIARDCHCDYIKFETARRGLIKKALSVGFVGSGITMHLKL